MKGLETPIVAVQVIVPCRLTPGMAISRIATRILSACFRASSPCSPGQRITDSSPPRRRITLARALHDHMGHVAQDDVAKLLHVAVVDAFAAVNVHDQQVDGRGFCSREMRLQADQQTSPIEQLGERILGGHAAEFVGKMSQHRAAAVRRRSRAAGCPGPNLHAHLPAGQSATDQKKQHVKQSRCTQSMLRVTLATVELLI